MSVKPVLSSDEQTAAAYLRRYALDPEKIAEGNEKRPDFLVVAPNGYCFFVEVKGWEPFPEDKGIVWEQFYRRLRDDVKTAAKQFRKVNSTRSAGNVLCLVSHECRFCRLEDLEVAMKGLLRLPGGRVMDVKPGFRKRDLRNYCLHVDVIVLLADNSSQPVVLFLDSDAHHRERLLRVLAQEKYEQPSA